MSDKIWFDPTSDKWALSDGEHYLEVPHWAWEIIVNEFERETRQLKTENTELWEQLAKARDPQRIGGTADPESFVYAIEQLREFRWQHATNDEEAIPYINNVADAHERENAKLRKLVRHMYECMCNVDADGNYECYSCEYENTDGNCDFERRMQELGVEVSA